MLNLSLEDEEKSFFLRIFIKKNTLLYSSTSGSSKSVPGVRATASSAKKRAQSASLP